MFDICLILFMIGSLYLLSYLLVVRNNFLLKKKKKSLFLRLLRSNIITNSISRIVTLAENGEVHFGRKADRPSPYSHRFTSGRERYGTHYVCHEKEDHKEKSLFNRPLEYRAYPQGGT